MRVGGDHADAAAGQLILGVLLMLTPYIHTYIHTYIQVIIGLWLLLMLTLAFYWVYSAVVWDVATQGPIEWAYQYVGTMVLYR
jgi:hypothetical protein